MTLTLRVGRTVGYALLVAALFLLLFPHLGFAATPVGPDAQTDSTFNLPPFTVSIIFGAIIPLLNGLVTKITTSSAVKAVLALALSTVAGIIQVSTTDNGGAIVSWSTVTAAVVTFIIQAAAYSSLYKPLALTSSPVTRVDESGVLVTEPGKLANVGVK